MGNGFEARLKADEDYLYHLPIRDIEARIAAVEQALWTLAGAASPSVGGGQQVYYAKTTSAFATGGSGTVNVYNNDMVTLSGVIVTIACPLKGPVAVGTNCFYALVGPTLAMISADCS